MIHFLNYQGVIITKNNQLKLVILPKIVFS